MWQERKAGLELGETLGSAPGGQPSSCSLGAPEKASAAEGQCVAQGHCALGVQGEAGEKPTRRLGSQWLVCVCVGGGWVGREG